MTNTTQYRLSTIRYGKPVSEVHSTYVASLLLPIWMKAEPHRTECRNLETGAVVSTFDLVDAYPEPIEELQYQISTFKYGKSISVFCSEGTAKVLLPFWVKAEPNLTTCRNLETGAVVSTFDLVDA